MIQQSGAGSLIVGHLAEVDDIMVMEGAQLGVEDLTDYEMNGAGVILTEDSVLAGDTLEINGNAVIEMGGRFLPAPQ